MSDVTAELAMEANDKAMEIARLKAENDRLRELVRNMFYAVHPLDREKFLTNVAELGVEVEQ